ncbi:hypothetical protein [Prosthecobacter vanneervenii]|uniref:Uncharacterized protein n=1 Tax=Prosthecobacter vanneervenii TaxID=48466 RepID=A0A7W8DL37_9BACT|nr:hypothetical protein [Prosthecobacter vanneervenii]MBB5033949.1 hypothetical protein [Prosthecobacter vanneervenii]
MTNKTRILTLAALVVVTSVFGTPTGLNNIPTAETIDHRTVAAQFFTSFGGSNQFATSGPGKTSQWAGFKTGWDFKPLHLEWGLDSALGTGYSGPLLFQTKARIQPWEDGMLAIGVAGVALTDTRRAGDPFTYAMMYHDFHVVRFHAGYGLQTRGDSYLFGVDRTWKLFDRNFNLNSDIVQSRNQHGIIASVGAKYFLSKHIVLESWMNFPDKDRTSWIAKINYVFTF